MKPLSLLVLFVTFSVAFLAQAKEDPYNQIGILKGQVFVSYNPELGRTPASGQYFVLQRIECPRCLVGVRADVDGRYTVSLGIGQYRVICADPETREDLMGKGQQREVTVRQRPKGV